MVTVFDIRKASQDEKAAVVDQRYSKPTTDTSGTATASSTNEKSQRMQTAMQELSKKGVEGFPLLFGAAMSSINPSFTVSGVAGGKPYSYNYYEQQFKKDVRAGKYATPTTPPKSPTSTTTPGINAPPPDQPWQPSSMSGLQAQEEDPLKRRR